MPIEIHGGGGGVYHTKRDIELLGEILGQA